MKKNNVDINALIASMTLKEKVGQLVQFTSHFFIKSNEALTGPAEKVGVAEKDLYTVGSVIGFSEAKDMIAIQDKHLKEDPHKIPLIFMMDVIHGYRTIYPIPLGLSGSFDPELVKDCSRMAAKEASASGVQVTFTPMVDYVRDIRWGRVMESCGEDPYLASIMGAAQVEAIQGDDISSPNHIAACVKHFAAYGGAEAGRDYNTVDVSERALREYFLPAYKACVDAGVKMLMPSFNSLNGVPSTANKWLMQDVLRDEWGFDGLVISDWGAVHELCVHGVAEDHKQASEMAFSNGCHIDMMAVAYYHNLEKLVNEGKISEDAINDAVRRVLELKKELGLFEDPYHNASTEKENNLVLCDAHREIVRRAAEESAILLKNDNVLPFSTDCKKIALIGPFAQNNDIIGPWSCHGKAEEATSVEEGIRKLLPDAEITSVNACSFIWNDTDTSGFEEAINAAKNADAVILCLGEPSEYSGEGNCRTNPTLPGVQSELAKQISAVNKNTAAIIFSGRPLILSDIHGFVPSILQMWFPGTEGGTAAADLLFGKANPCGKAAMSFPKSVGQCPIYYNCYSTGRPKSAKYENEHKAFRSNYIDCGNMPLYPFGHGLSYSNFVYEALTLDKDTFKEGEELTVTVTVYNDSDRAGKEVVQLYLRDLVASATRPIQSLIAFEKVEFTPYERKDITFKIVEPMLRFHDAKCNFISEAGKFTVSCGHAYDLLHTTEFTLEK